MGLSAALMRLQADRALDGVVRDVLVVFTRHSGVSFTTAEVARRSGHPVWTVEPILLTLARNFVLDFQSDPPGYRYVPDALLEIDVERYLRRVNVSTGRLQDNVARFRQRNEHF